MPIKFKLPPAASCVCPGCLIATLEHDGTVGVEEFSSTPSSAGDWVHVATNALTLSGTAVLRLRVAKYDSNNYLFGEVSRGGGIITIRLGKRKAGVETWLTTAVTVQDTGADLNLRHLISLCWKPGPLEDEEEVFQGGLPISVSTGAGGAGAWADTANVMDYEDTNDAVYAFQTGDTVTDTLILKFPLAFDTAATNFRYDLAVRSKQESGGDVTETSVRVMVGGTAVGDNKATNGSLSDSLPTTWGYGGDTDNWNVGTPPTVEQVNDPNNFGFILQFTHSNTVQENQAEVFWVTAVVYATMPERRSGRLTLAYGNTSVAEVDCVTDYSVVLTGDELSGLTGGIEVVSGTWDLEDNNFNYHLSPSRPTCPECECTIDDASEPCGCCDADFPSAAEYVVDLDVGGLTDDGCSGCDEIAGAYVLTNIATCIWQYEEELGTCVVNAVTVAATLRITLQLMSSGGTCKWRLSVAYGGTTIQDASNPEGAFFPTIYESSNLATDEDCQDPVTLTKVVDGTSFDACNGSLPATVDIEPA